MPPLDKSSSKPLYQQLYTQIADSIESGLYREGKKLPSIRAHARELGVSSTTIEAAYLKLASEGYIAAKRGSGYTVCAVGHTPANLVECFDSECQEAFAKLLESASFRDDTDIVRYDFSNDAADRSIFPVATWARISRAVFFGEGAEDACRRNDPQGLPALRWQIAQYVSEEHGITCFPEQVLVMPTVCDLVGAILELLPPSPIKLVMEEPGCDEIHHVLSSRGYDVSLLPVVPFPSWEEARGKFEGAGAAFVASACQISANCSMPLEFHEGLVEWVQHTGAYVIDFECGWDLQVGIACPPPLATLDRAGRIITIGTFSDCFTPALCLSYAILPPQLMLKWQDDHRSSRPQIPWQTQAAMAQFMAEGHWRGHVRKVRTAMERKRLRLLESVEKHMSSEIEVVSAPGSLFALMRARDGRSSEELVSLAFAEGIRVCPIDRCWHQGEPTNWRYVLVSYMGIDELDIDSGIKALAHVWRVDH